MPEITHDQLDTIMDASKKGMEVIEGLMADNLRLKGKLSQCKTELEEAANLLRPHYPRMAEIYEKAAQAAIESK